MAKKGISSLMVRYNKSKKMLKYLTLRAEIKGHSATSDMRITKAQRKFEMFRKQAAMELIKKNRDRRMSRGKGKKRGADSSLKRILAPIHAGKK